MTTNFVSPVGRFVQGSLFELQTTDGTGAPIVIKTGPNAGQPGSRSFFAVAYAKTDPLFAPFYAQMVAEAKAAFPAHFDAAGNCTHPSFAWKLMDGDGTDQNGKKNSEKEGFAGHWVIKFGGSFLPRVFYHGRTAPQDQVKDPNLCPRGYYIRVVGSMKGNQPSNKPGLYLNPDIVEVCGAGDIITSGPDATELLGGVAMALPAGAQALPGLPAAGAPGLPGMAAPAPQPAALPGMPAPMAVPGSAGALPGMPALAPTPALPAVAVAPAALPGLPVLPNHAAVAAVLATPQYQMTPQAVAAGLTREALNAQGHTDEVLIANGYMVRIG
jgi:hypothetical protein